MIALLTSSLLAIVYRIGGAVATALTFVLIARSMPLAEVGVYSISSAFVIVGRFLGPLGIDQLAIRILGNIDPDDDSYARGASSLLQAVIQCSAFICILVTGSAYFLLPANAPLFHVCVVTALIYFSMSMSGMMSILFRVSERNFLSFFPDSFMSPVIALAITLCLYALGEITMLSATSAILTGCVCCVTLQFWFNRGFRFRPLAASEMFGYLTRSFHLFLIQASSFLQQRSILYIALLVGGTASVAIIDTSLKFAMISTLATWAVGSMMAPKFVKLFKEKDITNAQFYFVAGSFAAFVPALGITLGFVLLGKFILHHLFGEQYVAAYLPTIIILASTAINAAGSLSSVVFMHNGFQKLVLRQTTWAIALGALVAVGAGHFLGEIGIALGTLVSSIVRDIGLSTMLFRHTGLRPGALSFSGWRMALQYGSKATKILTRRTGASS